MRKRLMLLAMCGIVVVTSLLGVGAAQASEPPGGEGGYACRVYHSAKKVSPTVLEFHTWADGPCKYAITVLTATVTGGGKQVGPVQKRCNPYVDDVNTATCMYRGITLRIANPSGTQTFTAVGYFQWAASLSATPKEGDYTKTSYKY